MNDKSSHGRSRNHPIRDFLLNTPVGTTIFLMGVFLIIWGFHEDAARAKEAMASQLRSLFDDSVIDKNRADDYVTGLSKMAMDHGAFSSSTLNTNSLNHDEYEHYLIMKGQLSNLVTSYNTNRLIYNDLMRQHDFVFTNFPWKLPREIKEY